MNATECVDKISGYFTGKTSQAVTDKMLSILSRLQDDQRETVYERMVEDNSPRFRVGVKEIIEACRALGIGYKKSFYTPTQEWTCEACGAVFTYVMVTSDEEKVEKHLFDKCPRCDFQPCWTIAARMYGNMEAPSYKRLLAERRHWVSEHPEPYFDRGLVEEEIREMRQIDVKRKIANIVAEKTVIVQGRLPYKE